MEVSDLSSTDTLHEQLIPHSVLQNMKPIPIIKQDPASSNIEGDQLKLLTSSNALLSNSYHPNNANNANACKL